MIQDITQMLPSTITAIVNANSAILGADPSITGDELNKIKAAIRDALTGKTEKAETPTERPPLYKRRDLKRLTGLSGVSIDRYARLGFLKRVHLGGSSRATGFTPESVEAFLAGRATTETGEAKGA